MDNEIKDIVKVINKTAKNLEIHLKNNIPVFNPEKNGIPEANLSFHFAHQCLKKGWFIYPEASNFSYYDQPESQGRIDLHVIVKDQFILTVESKKFYSAGTGKALIKDFERAELITYNHSFNYLPHYVLLLAITEKQQWENWWVNSQDWDNGSTWQHLAQILESEGMVRSSYVLNDDTKKHYLLYGIKQVR